MSKWKKDYLRLSTENVWLYIGRGRVIMPMWWWKCQIQVAPFSAADNINSTFEPALHFYQSSQIVKMPLMWTKSLTALKVTVQYYYTKQISWIYSIICSVECRQYIGAYNTPQRSRPGNELKWTAQKGCRQQPTARECQVGCKSSDNAE